MKNQNVSFFYIFMRLIFINTQKELYQIPTLPLQQEIEPRAVLKQMAKSHRRIVLTVYMVSPR